MGFVPTRFRPFRQRPNESCLPPVSASTPSRRTRLLPPPRLSDAPTRTSHRHLPRGRRRRRLPFPSPRARRTGHMGRPWIASSRDLHLRRGFGGGRRIPHPPPFSKRPPHAYHIENRQTVWWGRIHECENRPFHVGTGVARGASSLGRRKRRLLRSYVVRGVRPSSVDRSAGVSAGDRDFSGTEQPAARGLLPKV